MKGDFTRSTFDPKKHYTSVLMQQGRVQLDADWNEQADIQNYLRRQCIVDGMGQSFAPASSPGFEINRNNGSLSIGKGRYYVDGILCENEDTIDYQEQPDYPVEEEHPAGKYLAYLDVWERHITYLEDEDIREKALGTVDTATRAKTIWQVKLSPFSGSSGSTDVMASHTDSINAIAVSPDGSRLISASADRTVRLWDINNDPESVNLELQNILHGHESSVIAADLLEDRAISAAYDSAIKIWDPSTGDLVGTVAESISVNVKSVSLTPDENYVVAGYTDGTIKIWDISDPVNITLIATLDQNAGGHSGSVNCVVVSSDGMRLISGSSDRSIKIWDLSNLSSITLVDTLDASKGGHTDSVNALALNSAGTILASGSSDNRIYVWDISDLGDIPGPTSLMGHVGSVNSLSISPDGTLLGSGSSDETLKIWDLGTYELLWTLAGHTDRVNSVALYDVVNGETLHRAVSASSDRSIKFWDIDAGTLLLNVSGMPEASHLAVTLGSGEATEDLCASSSGGIYSGLDNRLYRVEIHESGDINTATFKWSRDNGSVVIRIAGFLQGSESAFCNQVRVDILGWDDVLKLKIGDWVEVIGDRSELLGMPGTMAQIEAIDEVPQGYIITLNEYITNIDEENAKLRLWASEPVNVSSLWQTLDNFIRVKFKSSDYYNTGDYWQIPARTNGEILWPGEADEFVERFGIAHHYANLAVVNYQALSGWSIEKDLRTKILPLSFINSFKSNIGIMLSYVGGDGQEGLPDDVLPSPLQVRVSNGGSPLEGADVVFEIREGSGSIVDATGTSKTVNTDSEGIAKCSIRLGPAEDDAPTLIRAKLLGTLEVNEPYIDFTARATFPSEASQVAYSPGCPKLSVADNVAEALDLLCHSENISYDPADGSKLDDLDPKPDNVKAALDEICDSRNIAYTPQSGSKLDDLDPKPDNVKDALDNICDSRNIAYTPQSGSKLDDLDPKPDNVEAALDGLCTLFKATEIALDPAITFYGTTHTNVQSLLSALCDKVNEEHPPPSP